LPLDNRKCFEFAVSPAGTEYWIAAGETRRNPQSGFNGDAPKGGH